MNAGITKVRKRDGRIVDFDAEKIRVAISKACHAVGENGETVEKATALVLKKLSERMAGTIPTVEQIQDIVEESLIEINKPRIAKAYILYRQKRKEIREEKMKLLNKETLDDVEKAMSLNSLRVVAARYLTKDEEGNIIESVSEMFERVALNVLIADILYDRQFYDIAHSQPLQETMDVSELMDMELSIDGHVMNEYHKLTLKRAFDVMNSEKTMKQPLAAVVEAIKNGEMDRYGKLFDEYFNMMKDRRFLPNTPAMANFGKKLSMGSACFVLGIDDDLTSIMNTLRDAALIFQAGGGCGYNFSNLRPEGDIISSTNGLASGPISFMELYDKMTDVIKQGGIRRGANMGILASDHPDVEKFVKAKEGNKRLRNFNISVLIKPDFWEYYRKNEPYPLINPRNGEVWKKINPRELMDSIAYHAWESAEPGVLFEDNINHLNPLLEELGPITTTNPCGEVLLYPNESCNLGSVNIHAFVKDGDIDWDSLEKTVKLATHFLDNVIDVNKFPLDAIRDATRRSRKVGLGVMGIASTLYELGIPYDSEEGLQKMEEIMERVNYYSKLESIELSKQRGPFPLFARSSYIRGEMGIQGYYDGGKLDWSSIVDGIKSYGLRNTYTTVLAPTGSLSMVADTSSGIEPVFALVYEKTTPLGSFYYVDDVFRKKLKEIGMDDDKIIEEIAEHDGSIQDMDFPDEMKRVFKTSRDIHYEYHIRAQAVFQKWVDSSISKTINMSADVTPEDVKNAYLLAHELGCKGLTIYRESSLETPVMKVKKKNEVKVSLEIPEPEGEEEETDEICPVCGSKMVREEGCLICKNCGYGKCS